MATPKNKKTFIEHLREQSNEIEKNSPVLQTRWFVVEYAPAKQYHDGYDLQWGNATTRIVSPYFSEFEEAEEWKDNHDPDDGFELIVKHENLREFRFRRWGF